MNKEQFNTFDDWFREASLQPGPPVHDAAWKAMEAKLDGQKKRRRAIFWWWFGGLFFAGGIFMFIWMNNQHTENRARTSVELPANSIQVIPDNTAGEEASKVSGHKAGDMNKEQDARIGAIPAAGQPNANGLAGGKKVAIAPGTENESKAATTNKPVGIPKETATVPAMVVKKKYANTTRYTAGRNQKSTLPKTNSPAIEHVNSKAAGKNAAAASLAQTGAEKDNLSNKDEVKTLVADSLLASDTTGQQTGKIVPVAATPKDSSVETKAGKSPKKPSHFYVFGAVAPEWSYVKARGAGDVSISYGLGVGYGFSKKWAIQAGVFLAGKKYTAGEGDYTLKTRSYYARSYITVESVDADCSVLEIPLSVRYTFLQKKKLQFFAVAGIVSTVMKEEKYDFDYTRLFFSSSSYSHYTYKTGDFNLFSTATLSVGMESRLNRHFSLLVAPYFNIPLQGIGEGKVYINSVGVQGGIKYNLPF